MTALAVDYGTSNTVAMLAWPDGRIRPLLFDGSPLLPSGVCLEHDGHLLAGRAAQRAGRVSPQSYEPNPKRRIDDVELLLGDRDVPVVTAIAATLDRVWQEVRRTLPAPPEQIVVTCPVAWGPARRAVLQDAAGRAGLPDVHLLAEPVAAATYYATEFDGRLPADGCLVVYDLGAGTFDVTVVRPTSEPLAYRGLDTFGSLDLDALVVSIASDVIGAAFAPLRAPRTLAEQRAFRALWSDASEAKEALSSRSSATLVVPIVDRDVVISREQFEELARPRLADTIDVTLQCVREARVPREQVSGLFLVGGGSRTPLIGTLLHRATGVAPTVLDQPELVVAEGALRWVLRRPEPRPLPVAPPPLDFGPAPEPIRYPAEPGPAPAPPPAPSVPSDPGGPVPASGPAGDPGPRIPSAGPAGGAGPSVPPADSVSGPHVRIPSSRPVGEPGAPTPVPGDPGAPTPVPGEVGDPGAPMPVPGEVGDPGAGMPSGPGAPGAVGVPYPEGPGSGHAGPFLPSALPPEIFGAGAAGLVIPALILAPLGFVLFVVSVPVILQTLSYGARYTPLTWLALLAGSVPSLLLITAAAYRLGRLRRAARLRVDDLGITVLAGNVGAERRLRGLGWIVPSPLLLLAALVFRYAWPGRADSVSALATALGVLGLVTGAIIGARSILPPGHQEVLAWRGIRTATLTRRGPLRRRTLTVLPTGPVTLPAPADRPGPAVPPARPRHLDARGLPAKRLAAALERHGGHRRSEPATTA
ncbi:Hsp70 family protein [Cryptosporangium japonicum]|uniref:Hsp70 protein n=1 Tax=Cryptosporangium japonicum TaxID=80872 RepID=A0ABP3DKL2_9ACTN